MTDFHEDRHSALMTWLAGAGACLLLATCAPQDSAPEQTEAVATFTAQAEAGAAAYATNCAACHGAELEGTILGPLLSGQSFVQRWGTQTPALLLGNIQSNMPPGGAGNMTDEDYLNIVAHMLAMNGVDSISNALTDTSDFVIAENISRVVALRRPPEPPLPRGYVLAELPRIRAVHAAYPRCRRVVSDPADLRPMHRRECTALQFFSVTVSVPLDEINTENVPT